MKTLEFYKSEYERHCDHAKKYLKEAEFCLNQSEKFLKEGLLYKNTEWSIKFSENLLKYEAQRTMATHYHLKILSLYKISHNWKIYGF